ncbi:serine/threonine-protein kinase [Piscinibacter sp.]|uniref:serine/threonine-protein kinase n=1 Tax=Piscinibacter sp. TaxID=1903157 RepID=UPI002C4D6F95|nr:serine/threonine-protein kinase [Albitalea sp.]HUG22959.1 serine/threonine-protein kinase [Albitalea sp.]
MIAAHADAALVAALGLAGSGTYVALALPRLPHRGGLLVTAALAVVLLAAAALFPASIGLALLAGGVLPLAFGQLGWSLSTTRSHAAGAAAWAPTAGRSPAKASAKPAPAAAAPTLDHKTLGRYLVDRQLGRGAMGAVYLGHDPKIGRQVAIKTMALSQEFDGPALTEARARFFREAETAGRLQHRDIVTIFDAGEDHELAYIAMEYLKGHDLQRYVAKARLLPVPQVLRIVARVADALAYAHSQGVVHRDIKPANVMIDPADDSVKVTDFGIARITDSSRTRTGMVLGTPSFMSPEQMAGRRVDGRSDLYSLGVMLFQMLCGRLPHNAESMAKLMYQIANDPAPDIRTLRPDLPETLANVVALALEKRPEVRYAGGRQLAEDLRTIEARLDPAAAMPVAENAEASPPNSDGFAATVELSRTDPRHNSGL